MNIPLVQQFATAWLTKLRPRSRKWLPLGAQAVLLTGLAITALVLGTRHFGGLQALELRAYDRMVRLRGQSEPDSRLLIVGITEEDLRRLKRHTPSDQTLAWALQKLQAHNPALIGLDLHREVPQHLGRADLARQLQADNVIVITQLGDSVETVIPPPPEVESEERIGFNDLLVDPDGVIRRNLLFGVTQDGTLYYSFSLRLALAYLATQNILPQSNDRYPDVLQLGASTFFPLQPHSGGYQSIDARGYQVLLDYRDRQVAAQVNFSDVLRNRVKPEQIENKIVLIGTVASSGKDLFYTPYTAGEGTHHQMPGVIVHAQMVGQILDAATGERPLFWFWPEWVEVLWIGGWALAGGTLAWWIRNTILLSAAGIGTISLLLGTSFIVFLHQGWIPVIAPTIAAVMTGGTIVTYRAQRSQRQQQMVMTLLGQNTSPEIAQALWHNRDRLLDSGKLPGQELTATLLFTDLRNFSTIAEQMPPEVLLDWLNEYLSAMTEEIQTYHGIINKFTGDGLLAVFGVPMARQHDAEIAQDAENAVRCALALGDRLDQLNQGWANRQLPVVQMRVGIFTGPIVAGSLGGKDRLEYGVIGDSVNIAARLESCEKDRHTGTCRILITNHTLDYLQDQFEVEPWGPLALKGRQQAVTVYRVMGTKPSRLNQSVADVSAFPAVELPTSDQIL